MRPADRELLGRLLRCPNCRGNLSYTELRYQCELCGSTFRIDGGIPVFADAASADHDELDHLFQRRPQDGFDLKSMHKATQALHFDRDAESEFEIERPSGTPALYHFLLTEKFRRAVEPISNHLAGLTVLAVCGGSGMDAEFLADAGAVVVTSDISLGAAQRARERARRHQVPLISIVADVEHLPFRDQSVDLVYVHDGLHHLIDPDAGIMEMARVARRWISINEPAKAALTSVAVKVRLAQSREDSGNRVARLDAHRVGSRLREAGFRVVQSHRYAMYYRHHPGRIFSVLSQPSTLGPATAAWRAVNFLIGSAGNKLSIVGERRAM